jgi:small subunit ribosomal protein S13
MIIMAKEFQHIIRILDTDLDGTKIIAYALTNIKGIGSRLADVIVKKAEIDPEARMGFLSEIKIQKLENVIKTISEQDLPGWFLNRPKSRETGKDSHLFGPDLILQTKSDIDLMKRIRSWKGFRHANSLKVRGQKTRTTGRRKKARAGIKRKGRTS